MADETPEVELTDKQQAFVLEYLKDKNGAAAAIRAGFSPRSAKQIAHQMMNEPAFAHVRDAVDTALAERSARLKIDTDDVVRAAWEIRERCMQRQAVYDDDGKPIGVWQFDAKGANTANALLAKHTGGFVDRKEITLPTGTGVLAVPVAPTAEQWSAGAAAQQAALVNRPSIVPGDES